VAGASSPEFGITPDVVCKPGSVSPHRGEGIIRLGAALLRHSSALTRALALRGVLRASRSRQRAYSSLLREGLAAPPVTRLSRVGSYPTISTLPEPTARRLSQRRADSRPSAVWFLLRFPSGHPGSLLATSLLCGARTFLPRTVACSPAIPATTSCVAILPGAAVWRRIQFLLDIDQSMYCIFVQYQINTHPWPPWSRPVP